MRGQLPTKDISGYPPKIETEEYQKMYLYYEGLGKERSLGRVAEEFSKSKSWVAVIARVFNWRHRINSIESRPKDPVVFDTREEVDKSRKDLIEVVTEIIDTLHELMFIARDIKLGKFEGDAEKLQARADRAGQLRGALSIWGFEWKGPKDLKSLIGTLKDITDFNKSSGQVPKNATQVNVDKFELNILDD